MQSWAGCNEEFLVEGGTLWGQNSRPKAKIREGYSGSEGAVSYTHLTLPTKRIV